MNRALLIRITIIIAIFSFCLYSYIDKQMELASLKMKTFEISKVLNRISSENERLTYEVEKFENPSNLMELARRPEFSHLKHPFVKDVLSVKEGVAFGTAK